MSCHFFTNWKRGMVFREAPKLPFSASERPDRRAEVKAKSGAEHRSLGFGDEMADVEEGDSLTAVGRITHERKAIDRKREDYYAVVRKMYYEGVKVGAGDIVMAKYAEKAALAFQELVDSCQNIVQIQEQSLDPDAVRTLAGDLLKIEIPVIKTVTKTQSVDIPIMDLLEISNTVNIPGVLNRKQHHTKSRTEIKTQTSQIPSNSQEYQILKNGAEMALLSARANLFLLTGDRIYADDYQRHIHQKYKNMAANGKTAIKRAEAADAKSLYAGESSVEKLMRIQDNAAKYREIKNYTQTLADKQLEIEKLRIKYPVEAYKMAGEFYASLDSLQKDMSGSPVARSGPGLLNLGITFMDAAFFKQLKISSPKVFQRFSQIVNICHGKAANLARDIFQKDPEILHFQRDLKAFMKSGEGVFKTFDALMKDMEKGNTPSRPFMEKIHEDLERYMNSPYFQNIRKIWPLEKYRKYLGSEPYIVPGAQNLLRNLSAGYDGLNEYVKNIEDIAQELKDIAGDYVGFQIGLRGLGKWGPRLSALNALFREAGKFAILIGACVLTGQGLTAIGAGTFATISTISAVSTLGGAALDYLDGNKGAFDPGALIEGYAQGVAMSAASGVLAKPVGVIWGKTARRINGVFAKSGFSWLRKFGEKGYLNKIFKGEKNETMLRKLMEELGEESFEEGLESVGRAIAPHDPWVGFFLSLLGTSAKTAKDVFRKGKFRVGKIRGEVTDSGVRLEYSDMAEIKAFLKQRGLPAELITQLETDGGLTVEKDGVRLEVGRVEAVEQEQEIGKMDYRASLLGKLLQSGNLILGRLGDIETGFLDKKLASLKYRAGIGRFTNREKARQKLIALMESDDYKFRPITVSITGDGKVDVSFDGNVRLYAAMMYDIDPGRIPVYCGDFGAVGERVANTTLKEVLDRAAGRIEYRKPTIGQSATELPDEELAKPDNPKVLHDFFVRLRKIDEAGGKTFHGSDEDRAKYRSWAMSQYRALFDDYRRASKVDVGIWKSFEEKLMNVFFRDVFVGGSQFVDIAYEFRQVFLNTPRLVGIMKSQLSVIEPSMVSDQLFFVCFALIKNQPEAGSILLARAVSKPAGFFNYLHNFLNEPYVENIILQMAEKYPEMALRYAKTYLDEPCAAGVIREAVARMPDEDVLKHAEKFACRPFGKKIIEEFVKKLVEREPVLLLRQVNFFANEPYAGEAIRGAFRSLVDRGSVPQNLVNSSFNTIFEYFDLLKSQEYAGEIIRAVAAKRPDIALEHAEKYVGQPYAEEVIRAAAMRVPALALVYAKKYVEQPYFGEEVLRQAAVEAFERDPADAIKGFSHWMRDLFTPAELKEMTGSAVEKLMDSNPSLLWKNRFNLFFTKQQMSSLQRSILENGNSESLEKLIVSFLNFDERFPISEETARLAVERLILIRGEIVRNVDDPNAQAAVYEKKLQDFIWGHIDRVIENRKNDPEKAARIIYSLHQQAFPRNYFREARELVAGLKGRDEKWVKNLYDLIYSTHTAAFEEKVFAKFVEIFEAEGEAKAGEYIKGLNEKAKDLVGTEIPAELRGSEEYMYYVKYVFPAGNYSSHDENLAMGDQVGHLGGYKFNKDGYPVELAGLLGHKFKDVRTEAEVEGEPSSFHRQHLVLMEVYQQRLSRIRDFVASRGPNNEALREAFDAKIDTLFQAKVLREYRELTGLSSKEKMLVLFISEAVRKGQSGRNFTPDAEILDLIIEYKYAYHENLEGYVQRSADTVQKGRDEATQHYLLWSELSTIYGENLKHILRHDIFEGLAGGENYPKIVDIFTRLITPVEEQDLTAKQWGNFENTFSNPNIPAEKRFAIIYKQIAGLVSSNIKFKSDAEKARFTEELQKICQKLGEKGDFTLEDFKALVPELFALRNRYRFDINAKLDELFSSDINTILAEIAKYEPLIEEEAKETTMGGEKHKGVRKSAKPRKIRSFFMKTKESANARMGAYLCIAGDGKMWENKNYFEMVMKNEETGKVVGLAMLMNVQAKDGKKYLWFGPNPFEGFLEQVSSKQTYDYMLRVVAEFAAANGYDGVVVPSQDSQILGGCTNRGGDFPDIIKASRLRDGKGRLKIVRFGGTHTLGGNYSYEDGALVWERKAKIGAKDKPTDQAVD